MQQSGALDDDHPTFQLLLAVAGRFSLDVKYGTGIFGNLDGMFQSMPQIVRQVVF